MVKNQAEYEELMAAAEMLAYTDATTDPVEKAELMEKADRLNAFQEERFDGIPEAATYRRVGYNLDSGDYWAGVYAMVDRSVKDTGYTSAPKYLDVGEIA